MHRWEDEVEDEGIERIRSTSGKSGNETKECLFLVYSKCCITSSLASLHRNVLTTSENKNVMILSFFSFAVQMDTWHMQKDKDMKTYKIHTEIRNSK